MTQTILDILAEAGAGTISSLWLPILAWTVLVMTALGVLQYCRLGVHLQYRVRQGLLLALPIGLLFGIPDSWVSTPGLFTSDIQSALKLPVQGPVHLSLPEASSSSPLPSWSWLHTAGLLTLMACGIGVYRLTQFLADAFALLRARKQYNFRSPPSVQRLTNQLANDLGVQRAVHTKIAPGDVVPQTAGVFRPTIIVPGSLTDDRGALRMTLTHELTHVRRYDCVAQWIERLVASVFAIHPGVGMLCRSIDRLREQSCDAAVLDTETADRSKYAALLYRLSTALSTQNGFALQIGDADSSLQHRIRAMHQYPSSTDSSALTGVAIGVLIVGLTVAIAACSDLGGEAPTPPPKPTVGATGHSEVLLSGRVIDRQTGEPIPRVNIIRAYDEDEGAFREGFGVGIGATNENGKFTASGLSPGSHRLIISCVGYERQTREITLRAGHPQQVTIALRRETVSLGGVEVEASDTE